MFQVGFRVAASSLAVALALTSGVGAQGIQKGGGGGGGRGAPAAAPVQRSAPAPMARPSAPAMRSAPPAMRQVAPPPRQVAPRQFQSAPRQVAPRQVTPRQVAPTQRVAPRFAAPSGPKGALRRGVNPRVGLSRDQLKAGSRAATRRELRQQSGAKQSGTKQFGTKQFGSKSKLTAGETARQRAADRRQQIIDNRQAGGKARARLRENLKAGTTPARTVGARTAGSPERALIRRGKGDRQLMLRNRSLADRSARTPATRALAQSTFGGRYYASRFGNWDRRHWRHRHRHIFVLGWIGPLFWPYAYDDFVDYTFWPYAYDAFWPYAYDDVYEGFFGPYAIGGPAYAELPPGGAPYASGGGVRTGVGPRTAARGPAGGAAMAQICTGETAGLTDWPVERIAEAINPDESQRAALSELRDAAARAVKVLQSACPDDLPSTPAGRVAAMRQRLEAMRDAVQIVRPALDAFYAALNDEQKARFNALEPEQATAATAKARKAELSQVCSAAVTKTNAAPSARIRQVLRLSAEQRTALDNLDAATVKAAEMLAANCPTEETLTPPGRLAAMEGRLNAMLQALDVVQPALVDFYGSLTDEQKARFNQLGVRRQAAR